LIQLLLGLDFYGAGVGARCNLWAFHSEGLVPATSLREIAGELVDMAVLAASPSRAPARSFVERVTNEDIPETAVEGS
jgi:hypothetical protein